MFKWVSDYGLAYSSKHDSHAQFHEVLYSLPAAAVGTSGLFARSHGVYTGPKTELEFKNGTKKQYTNHADIQSGFFFKIFDGESFYDTVWNGTTSNHVTYSASAVSKRDSNPRTLLVGGGEPGEKEKEEMKKQMKKASDEQIKKFRSGYPSNHVAVTHSGLIAGYFLDEKPDSAVLSILGALESSRGGGPIKTDQKLIQDFFQKCAQQKKTRLLIDASSTGMGDIFMPPKLVKMIFGDHDQNNIQAGRLRAHEQLSLLGSKEQELEDNSKKGQNDDSYDSADSFMSLKSYIKMDNTKFANWTDFYGPDELNKNKNFTRLARLNPNNTYVATGFSDLPTAANFKSEKLPRHFEPENVVLLTDGVCDSSCAILADLLKRQGVKTVAVGGLPQDGPMQVVGGSRGLEKLIPNDLVNIVTTAFEKDKSSEQERQQWDKTLLGNIIKSASVFRKRSSYTGTNLAPSVNLRTSFGESGVPTQFEFMPATCRIRFTKDRFDDIQKLWTAALNAIFSNGKGVSDSGCKNS